MQNVHWLLVSELIYVHWSILRHVVRIQVVARPICWCSWRCRTYPRQPEYVNIPAMAMLCSMRDFRELPNEILESAGTTI